MAIANKVLWSEGILLGQQHFQQWDHYFEQQLAWHNQISQAFFWGCRQLSIDESALRNGQFRLLSCQIILPNCLLINFDHRTDSELVCQLRNSGEDQLEVFLGAPMQRSVSGMQGYPAPQRLPLWQADYRTVADEFDTAREREMQFGRLNLQLLQK